MELLFFYLPFLIVIPLLLIAGILFVVVPGGFIIVFIGAYYALAAISQLAAVAVGRALLAARARRARARAAYSLRRRDEAAASAQRLGRVAHETGR